MPTYPTAEEPKHLIQVTVTGQAVESMLVEAEPNPLPGRGAADAIEPGDSVTWEFTGLRDGQLPLVFFRELRSSPSGPGSEVDLLGPFKTLSLSRDRVVASDADDRLGRFIYKIAVIESLADPRPPEIHELRWIDGLDGENFGGIDKPRTPEGR